MSECATSCVFCFPTRVHNNGGLYSSVLIMRSSLIVPSPSESRAARQTKEVFSISFNYNFSIISRIVAAMSCGSSRTQPVIS
jgi:hypothetical protein